MKFTELISDIKPEKCINNLDSEITGVSCDSRLVKSGDLFVTWQGSRADGMTFVQEALKRGAAGLCLDKDIFPSMKVPCVLVKDSRKALAQIACRFYANPTGRLKVIGITGTNGKTTVAFMIESILAAAGLSPGLLGTIHYKIGHRVIPSERTTPESLYLQRYFKEMLDEGCQTAVMEVSSHALAQGRVRQIQFHGGVFTNLSQDHLDYHRDLEDYFLAKAMLFDGLSSDHFAAVNMDDVYGRRLMRMTAGRLVSYGFSADAMISLQDRVMDSKGSLLKIKFPEGVLEIQTKMMGDFNISNTLAAFAAGWALGLDGDVLKKGLEAMECVPGRMEFVRIEAPFQVVVDYAHTEDAIRNVLGSLRHLAKNRLIIVFGCGGDRDRTKRSLMGKAAAQLSDFVILTSDNPRSENPADIVRDIEAGVREYHTPYEKIVDRKKAIEQVLKTGQEGDIVLIAGKGHEKFQEMGSSKLFFDDVMTVKEIWKTLLPKHMQANGR